MGTDRSSQRIPVILDTDIGGDIDDTWALVMMLLSPELDLKLVVTDTGNTTYRAQVTAKLLEVAGRTGIPIGIGLHQSDDLGPQAPWVAGYDLAAYPGEVHADGVGTLIDAIMTSEDPVTLVCIGPVPNIAAALEREPRIAERARFVGMHGSVRLGYGGHTPVSAEYNVAADPASCRAAFAAPWEVTITPLDTCGIVQLTGAKYRSVRDHDTPLIQALMENYRIWAKEVTWAGDLDPDTGSSTLFDTVAAYLAFSEELLVVEALPLVVTDDGYTRVDPTGPMVRCATAWKDLAAFEDLLVARLTGLASDSV